MEKADITRGVTVEWFAKYSGSEIDETCPHCGYPELKVLVAGKSDIKCPECGQWVLVVFEMI